MSMWLNLAKISPETLAAVRERPKEMVDALFSGDDLPPGIDHRTDILGCDYRTLDAVAGAKAETDLGSDDWRTHYPWLARTTGDAADDAIENVEFGYGGAFILTPDAVVATAEGLAAEGWDFDDAEFGGDESGGLPDDDSLYEDFVDILPFLRAAAREGKAVVGGIS